MELTKDQIRGLMFYHQQKIAGMAQYSGLLDDRSLDVLQENVNQLRTLWGHYERHLEAEQAVTR